MDQKQRHRTGWSKDEDAFLRANGELSLKALSNAIGRTIYAVQRRRIKLGLGQRNRYMPFCKVCGKPRFIETTHALCEEHYLEYYRTLQQRLRDGKKQKVSQ